jgi:ABC-type Fe3+/spermidine/putrescine transport system ATPase subunit
MSGPLVRFEGVGKAFADQIALDGVDLDIHAGEFFALLGPSGCGKTTLLRLLAGFETATSGRVLLDGEDLAGTQPHQRPVNMMFQSYALFPHLNVEQNIGFGLKMQGLGKAEVAARVTELLALMRLEPFAARKPDQLSGGQQQRVALARALARRPKVLLLDEPLAALDRKLRDETRAELKDLQRRLGATFVIVTHDRDEAMVMADRIAVMDQGRIAQVGTPAEVYERPVNRQVAGFLGEANFLETGSGGWIMVRPEKMELSVNAVKAGARVFEGVIRQAAYLGDRTNYRVEADGKQLTAVRGGKGAGVGDRVWLSYAADDVVTLNQ